LNVRTPALKNDLDLVVETNGGTGTKRYLPTNPLTGTRKVDDRDTVEKVILTTDELKGVTSLKITVKGTKVPQGPQPFALVAGGAVNPPVKPTTPIPDDPPGNVIIDQIEDTIESGGQNNNGGGGSSASNQNISPETAFSVKNASTFGIIVFANVVALLLILIVVIVLKVVGSWCCLAQSCALIVALIARGLALVMIIISFVFVAIEQTNIEAFVATAKFGSFWQQILMLVALFLAVTMVIIGGLLGVMQVINGPSQAMNVVLMIGDSIVALFLGAASIAAANVGKERYFFLRQSIAALITMCLFLVVMLIDAAQAFSDSDDEPAKPASNYKPSYNKTSYKTETATSTTAASRRDAPAPPKEPSRPRPKSTRGEILVALYDYQGQEADELDFQEGARIELLEDHLDGWASGVILDTRKEGLFPLNYTEKEQ